MFLEQQVSDGVYDAVMEFNISYVAASVKIVWVIVGGGVRSVIL